MKLPHSCKREEGKGITQKVYDTIFQDEKIAIIGYSGRAINYTAKALGMKTLVVDCFADMDLRRSADEFVYVNLDEYRSSEGNLDNSAAFYLCKETQSQIQKIQHQDYIILGSSFENDLAAWTQVSKVKNYVGNTPSSANKTRNPSSLFPFLTKHEINYPRSVIFRETEKSLDFQVYSNIESSSLKSLKIQEMTENSIYQTLINHITPPFVLKSSKSGGGFGIYLIQSEQEFIERFESLKNFRQPPFLAQEYIQGTAMSCSFLANGSHAKVHTISEQIIGDTRFGCSGKFTYCGNIMNEEISDPLHENNAEITPLLEKIAQGLTEFGELKGSNGIDFVLQQRGNQKLLYFIELNPRFQGTIDLVLASTGENLVYHHIKSSKHRELPVDVGFPDNKTYLKIIYYSPLDFHILVDLQGLDLRDVPLIGSFIPESGPICSNIVIGTDISDAYAKALEDQDLMIRVLGLKSRILDKKEISNQ
ncbi:MAG: ATP-grasp domain-containing protein [Promethearchaeota archaeon]|nr:MAG: ATP-grasp domain-containing protein [Candidatus Lokiarchaeota archaeon]